MDGIGLSRTGMAFLLITSTSCFKLAQPKEDAAALALGKLVLSRVRTRMGA